MRRLFAIAVEQCTSDVSLRHHLVRQLLDHSAAANGSATTMRWQLGAIDEPQFRWLMQSGLGPLLHHATREQPDVPATWRAALLGADLTAQVRHGNQVDTACEVIDLCTRGGIAVTLLKGISTSEELYPAAHLRPMGDIDLLVPGADCAGLESALLQQGYRQAEWPENMPHHHAVPLHHPGHDVWVEIHTDLFPAYDALHASGVFTRAHVGAHSIPSAFHQRTVKRLTHELQLVYVAASWMRDLTVLDIQPSFLPSLFDALFLLRSAGRVLRWDTVLASLSDDMATACLHVMLTYIERHGWFEFPAPLLAHVAARQSIVGTVQTRAIHWMLDRYLVGGRRWHFALPPPVPGRYSLRHQWRKRISGGRRQAGID